MTPSELRAHCDSLGFGGVTRLAEKTGIHRTLLTKKMSGRVKIRKGDVLLIEKAMKLLKKLKRTKRVNQPRKDKS